MDQPPSPTAICNGALTESRANNTNHEIGMREPCREAVVLHRPETIACMCVCVCMRQLEANLA